MQLIFFAILIAIANAFFSVSIEMSAGHIIYSTKLESSLNSISVTGKHRSSL
jgi:hypothetical protein